jgi:uncharacterized protein with NRDE domain
MCLFALFYRIVDSAPVVAGANREEAYARGGNLPALLDGAIPAIAGTDPVAGGTWLGVNSCGVLVAVTNRRKEGRPKSPRSRGLLARDLLTLASAREAGDTATRELDRGRYDGCNILCADAVDAVVVEGGDWLRVKPLPPGLHILANRDVNDNADPRVGYAAHWLSQRQYAGVDHCLLALRELCGKTGRDGPAICLRGETRGTVSSTAIALRIPLERSIYLHAQGPPDRTPYADYSHLFPEMLGVD